MQVFEFTHKYGLDPYEIGKVLFVRQKKEKLPYEIGKLKSIRQLADLAAV